ncbi:hypothetical protein PAT3040_06368, partial [Paenibacillus agaridevorans]
ALGLTIMKAEVPASGKRTRGKG